MNYYDFACKTIFYPRTSFYDQYIFLLCSSVQDRCPTSYVLIEQSLLHEAHHVSDRNSLARRNGQLCRLYCEPARERCSNDGLSHKLVHPLPRSDSVAPKCPIQSCRNTVLHSFPCFTTTPPDAICWFQRLVIYLI